MDFFVEKSNILEYYNSEVVNKICKVYLYR